MSRPKGSKNRPKFQQLSFDNPGLITGDINQAEKLLSGKLIKNEVTNTMKDMHHIVQKVSVESLPKAEGYLREWFDKGYELFQVIFLGIEDAGATYSVM